MLKTPMLLAWFAWSLAACGGTRAAGAGAEGGTGAGGQSGNADSSASADGVMKGGSACVQSSDPPAFRGSTCVDLEGLSVSDLIVVGPDGPAGFVSPGDVASLQMVLNETAGQLFNWYPGVAFEADRPDVTFMFDGWYYAILPCQSLPITARAAFAPTVPVGTTVHMLVRPASLNRDCPGAPALAFEVVVR